MTGAIRRQGVGDEGLLAAIKYAARGLAGYYYRRKSAVLRLNGRQINHKRIYRLKRDHRLLLHRRGDKPISSPRQECRIAVDTDNTRW
jgi:putative transposase